MATNKEKAYLGNMLKFLVDIKSDGFDMDQDNFEITLKRSSYSRTFQKSDLVVETYVETVGGEPVEKHNYYLCFDSEEFGKGAIQATTKAYVPDDDFDGGFREEVDKTILISIIS